jgi:LysM repeat protein
MKFIFTIIFCFLLTILSLNTSAQRVRITTSNEQEVVGGKLFLLHHVKAKETLYSISKAYNVPANIIIECNNKKNFKLSIGEILSIPKDEEKDNRYFYKTIKRGETLYSIFRNTGVSVDAIIEHNTNIRDAHDIAIGTYIRIPKDSVKNTEFSLMKIKTNRTIAKAIDSIKSIKDSIFLTKAILQAECNTNNFELEKNNIIKIPTSHTFTLDSVNKTNINIALFLPLFLNENDILNKATYRDNGDIIEQEKKIYYKSHKFIDFYQGFISACDSLKDKGFTINLHTYDTAKNIDTVRNTIDSLDFKQFDFIVGPPYAATFKIAADKAQEERTPIISPLSDNINATRNNPYVIQINTSEKTIMHKTADYIYNKFSNSNIVVVYPKNYQLHTEAKLVTHLEDLLFSGAKYNSHTEIKYRKISFDKYHLYGVKHVLRKDMENIIIVPTKDKSDIYNIIPSINALTDKYNISLIALPSWRRYTSLDPATFFKANTRMLSNSYINYKSERTIAFVNDYRNKYYSEPSRFSFRAYDLAKYFIIASAESKINKLIYSNEKTDLLQSCFKFEKDNELLGKENKGLHILHYNKNYSIEKE